QVDLEPSSGRLVVGEPAADRRAGVPDLTTPIGVSESVDGAGRVEVRQEGEVEPSGYPLGRDEAVGAVPFGGLVEAFVPDEDAVRAQDVDAVVERLRFDVDALVAEIRVE